MENIESFEEEKKHLGKLPKEVQWLHRAKEEKTWNLEEPSILFTSKIMSKIKAKQEKPVFHKGVIVVFGLTWGLILGLGIWKSLENTSSIKWKIPDWDFSKLSNLFQIEMNGTITFLAYLLVLFWGLFLLNKILQNNPLKKNELYK